MTYWHRHAFLVLALLFFPGCGEPGKSGAAPPESDLRITDARMTLPPPGRPMGAIYLRLQNNSSRDRHLLEVRTDIAEVAEVHRSVYEDGVVRMRRVDHPVIAAGQSLVFEPGGYHVMLMDLQPLSPELQQFQLRLTFDGGETLVTDVELLAP